MAVKNIQENQTKEKEGSDSNENKTIIKSFKKRWSSLSPIIKYVLFTFFIFIFFLYVNFPFAKLKEIIIYQVEKNTPYAIELKEVDSHLITGLKFKGLKLFSGKEKDGEKGLLVAFKDLSVWLNPLPLLWGNLNVKYNSTIQKGTLEGKIKKSGKSIYLNAEVEKLSLQELKLFKTLWDKQFEGIISGEAEIETELDNFTKLEGAVNLTGTNFKLVELKVNTAMGPITLPTILFKKMKNEIYASQGTLNIKDISLSGDSLTIELQGKVILEKELGKSKLDLNMRFRLEGEMKTKFSIFLQSIPLKQGFYNINLVGTIDSPRCPQCP